MYSIYSQTQPVVGAAVKAGIPTPSTPVAQGNPTGQQYPTVAAAVGTAVKNGTNGYNGTTAAGQKQAGSLNVNGVLVVAPGKNTPLS